MAIATTTQLRQRLKLDTTANDLLLCEILDQAQSAVEGWCGHAFEVREIRETVQRDLSTGIVCLSEYPVQSFIGVYAGRVDALRVTSSDPTDIFTNATTTATGVRLLRIASDGTSTETTVLYTTAKTMAAMASAISAVTGFAATSLVSAPSWSLDPYGMGETLQAYDLTLPLAPKVGNSTGVLLLGSAVESWPVSHRDRGIVYPPPTVLAWYRAGHDPVPDAVVEAVLAVAQRIWFERGRDLSMKSESLGDYTYTLRDGDADDSAVMRRLDPWRRIR